ncbi:MAG: DALR anticodon-binding domain-containing protein [Micromonosporaceae bacterium]
MLTADTPAQRSNRLALVDLTVRTMAHGLGRLGLHAPERM